MPCRGRVYERRATVRNRARNRAPPHAAAVRPAQYPHTPAVTVRLAKASATDTRLVRPPAGWLASFGRRPAHRRTTSGFAASTEPGYPDRRAALDSRVEAVCGRRSGHPTPREGEGLAARIIPACRSLA